jgi:hypothetical protein
LARLLGAAGSLGRTRTLLSPEVKQLYARSRCELGSIQQLMSLRDKSSVAET